MKKALAHLLKKSEINDFVTAVDSGLKSIHIQNTNEENGLVLALLLTHKKERPLVLVAPNLYHAQLLYDKLSLVFKKCEVCFFPQDEFVTTEMLVSSWEFRIERIHTLITLVEKKPMILVTHLPGLLKPLRLVNDWKKAKISLFTNDKIQMDMLVKRLVEFGYSREYTVEKMGDFSVRGGIVDIFPMGEAQPIRCDMFDEDIDTIKTFDVETQRSIKHIDNFDIYPMTEFFYDDFELNHIESVVQQKIDSLTISEAAKNQIFQDLDSLANRENLDRLNRYLSFLPGEHSRLLDFLPEAVVLYFDHERLIDQYKLLVHDLSEWTMESGDYAKLGFTFFSSLESLLPKQQIHFDYFYCESTTKHDKTLHLFGEDPLHFNGNLPLFIQEIKHLYQDTTILVATATKKSMDQLIEVFNDNVLPFRPLQSSDELEKGIINLIISDEYFDFYTSTGDLIVITDAAFQKKAISKRKGQYVSVYENSKRLTAISDLKHGDYVVHYDYGIGRFLDIKTVELGNTKNDYIHLEYRDGDKLYIPLEAISQIQKYAGSEGFLPRLSKLGGTDWDRTKARVRAKVKDLADRLIKLYSQREKASGFAYQPYLDMENELAADFPYEETVDQARAIQEILADMELPRPMDRLLCGDVGFGKTEVALRAAFRAVLNEKQVAYLAPTTVLSRQHYLTFTDRLAKFGVEVALLNRFVSRKQQQHLLERLKNGTIDILIGTHRILSKDVTFRDLGLLIVDEEQRFGVEHKERIKELKVNVDVLSLSATPIPRTMQMAIMGVKSMSLLETAPENRYPIQTYVLEQNDHIIKDAIERELARKGQVFYLYNRIDDIDTIARKIQYLVPDARIEIAHGQMSKTALESVIEAFIDQKLDVLISTTIIETGIDIPNANTLIIHEADKLGLAQLYQIRGRVGRSDRIAYAFLMYKKHKQLTEDAEKRLKVIKEFTELGSGFKIAIRDLSIRGAGDVLGSEQSGFIDSVGIDLYLKILEEEIRDQQGTPVEKETLPPVKATVSRYIDETYIEDDFVKIEMHKKIDRIQTTAEINELLNEFKDRFGRYEPELEIYMMERLFEKLSEKIQAEKIMERKTNVTLILSEEITQRIAGDQLFSTGIQLSKFIRFALKNNKIHIILDTIGLDRHWLFTMVPFLEALTREKNLYKK
ncbi:MAG: transcription-repair coupling factor [Candidatus Izemoplasmatales bacterium]